MPDVYALNTEQHQAVIHSDGPLLIIAGAGTGKTTVVTQRIKHLILEKKIPTSEILALTFTDKSAREMEERIDVALPYGYTQLWISTFHAFCDRILRDEAIHIGLNPGYKLMTEAESILFLRKHLFQLKLNYFRPLGNPYKFLQGFLTHINRLKDDDISPEDYLKFAKKFSEKDNVIARKNDEAIPGRNGKSHGIAALPLVARNDINLGAHKEDAIKTLELARAYQKFEELKSQEGVMDFSDLNANVLKLFRTRKNVLTYYQNKFQYIMVDEFQDTNFAQNELAILLAGKKQNLAVVGDDDQAIYRWRGAAIANILQFRSHFPNAKIITLSKNYRSTQEILDRAYQLIRFNNPDRLEIKENINKKLTAERTEKGSPVEFIFAPRVENEAEAVVNKISELVSGNNRTAPGKKKYDYKDFAILVRANDHSRPFVSALTRAKIPFQFLGPGHLFHQEEIKDLIAYLKVLYNFDDNSSLYRVLTMPLFGMEARDIAAILNFSKKKNYTLFEALEQIEDTNLHTETKEIIKNLAAMIKRHLKHVPREAAGQILYYFFEDSGLLTKYLEASSPTEERKAQNIARFFEKLKRFEAENADASIFAVVDWIDLAMEMGESPLAADSDWTENNAVNIMTVHSSKGLEFPIVFLVSLVSQRFPSRDRKEQIPVPESLIKETLPEGDYNLQEERRLFYVGMTRARDLLYLSAAYYYGEGKRERKISPFVYETLGMGSVKKILDTKKEEQFVHQLSLLEILQEEQRKDALNLEITPGTSDRPVLSYMSYSQIQTFDICPLHYKLRYLLKIPPSPVVALNFGISMHAFMKDYYQTLIRGEKVTDPIIDMLLKKNWINEGYQSKLHEQEAFKNAQNIIARYIQGNNDNSNLPIALEIPFHFYVKNLRVLGRLDRVDKLEDGRIEIIDYKTGTNVPDEKKLKQDLQLTMYALAATEVNDPIFKKTPEEVVLSLYYLEKGIKITTTRTKEDLEAAKEYILQKAEEISRSNFVCSGSIFCKACEYKMICQTFGE